MPSEGCFCFLLAASVLLLHRRALPPHALLRALVFLLAAVRVQRRVDLVFRKILGSRLSANARAFCLLLRFLVATHSALGLAAAGLASVALEAAFARELVLEALELVDVGLVDEALRVLVLVDVRQALAVATEEAVVFLALGFELVFDFGEVLDGSVLVELDDVDALACSVDGFEVLFGQRCLFEVELLQLLALALELLCNLLLFIQQSLVLALQLGFRVLGIFVD